jgi:hypothetical protein
VGTDAPYDALITSEYNQTPQFTALVALLTAGVGDVTALIQSIPAAFDLNGGAYGIQLDILGQWIGQPRIIPNVLITGFFGFSDLATGAPLGLQQPFGDLADASIGGIWYSLGQPASATTVLTDAQYLTVLNARIARNQSNGTLSALEAALFDIFGVGAKVVDNGTLSLAITVSQPVSPVDQALVTQLDILPRPAGVAIASITYQP